MKSTIYKSLLLFFTCTLSPLVSGQTIVSSFSAGVGYSLDDEVLARVGLQHYFDSAWWVSDTGALSAYMDVSYSHLFLSETNDVTIYALSPVFYYEFHQSIYQAKPRIEFGVGASYISEKKIIDRNMGGHFQFEDRIGAGLKWEQVYLSLLYLHYSNGGIYSENAGYNTVQLNLQIDL